MAEQLSNEQLDEQGTLTRFMEKVFDAVVNQRTQALRRAAAKDPELRSILTQLEQSRKRLEALARKSSSKVTPADLGL